MASLAVRWLGIRRSGYFDDFGMVTAESVIRGAFRAFAALTDTLGFDPKIEKSEWGAGLGF